MKEKILRPQPFTASIKYWHQSVSIGKTSMQSGHKTRQQLLEGILGNAGNRSVKKR